MPAKWRACPGSGLHTTCPNAMASDHSLPLDQFCCFCSKQVKAINTHDGYVAPRHKEDGDGHADSGARPRNRGADCVRVLQGG